MIERRTLIGEVVRRYPETVAVFEKYGIGCVGCKAALFEDVQEGAEVHGIPVDALVNSLNEIISKD